MVVFEALAVGFAVGAAVYTMVNAWRMLRHVGDAFDRLTQQFIAMAFAVVGLACAITGLVLR